MMPSTILSLRGNLRLPALIYKPTDECQWEVGAQKGVGGNGEEALRKGANGIPNFWFMVMGEGK